MTTTTKKAKGRIVQAEGKLADLLADVATEVEDLAGEMGDWRDNMSGTGLENTSKYEEVSEAADTLENAQSSLEYATERLIELIEDIADNPVKYSYWQRYGRHISRAARLDQALTGANTAVEAIEEWLETLKGGAEEDEDTSKAQEIEDALESVKDALSEAEGVDFPGMY